MTDQVPRRSASGASSWGEAQTTDARGSSSLSSDFRALFDAAPTPLLVIAPPHWTIVAANDARLRVTATTREGQIGRKLFDVFPDDPEDPQADGVRNLAASLQRVLTTKAADTMAVQRYAVRDADGRFEERWWSPVNTPVLGEDGEVALVIHRVEEVTEIVRLRGEAEARDQLARDQQSIIDRLRATEAELRASEERTRLLTDSATDYAIFTTDPERIITSWSPGAAAIFGWQEEQIVGRPADILFTPEDRDAGVPWWETDVASRSGVAPDVRWHLCEDGSRFFAQGSVRSLHREDGSLRGFLKVARDATEERRTEAALRTSEESLRLATDAAEVGTWDLDLTTGVLTWSDRTKAAFGISPGVPCSMDDFYAGLHPDDREATSAAFGSAIDPVDRATYDVEYRTVGKEDRIVRRVAAKGKGIFDDQGRCLRAVGTAIDVTERRAADERLQALNIDLEEQIAERTLARGRLWELSSDLMSVANAEGYLEAFNPAWQQTLGWSEAELAATPFRDLLHPEDLARTMEGWIDLTVRNAPVVNFENRYRHKNGSWRWLSWTAAQEGSKVYSITRDTTEAKAQAAALAERTAERNRLWETSPDLLAVLDFDGVFRAINPSWSAIRGLSSDELISTRVDRLIHPDDIALTEDALATATVTELPITRNRYRHKDGSYRWIEWKAAPSATEIFAAGRDITAEKAQAEALAATTCELQAAQGRQRAVFDTTRQLIGVLDLNGTLQDVNAAALGAIGATWGEVVGRPFWETPWFIGTPGMPDVVRGGFEAARVGETLRTEMALNLPDGSTRIYDFAMAPVRDEHGQVIEIVPEATDITQQREIEERLRQAQKMEAVGQLTGGIAHDFNNMLAVVIGSLDLLGRRIGVADARAKRYVDAAADGARRAALLTQRLLAFSRQQPLQPEPIDANKLVAGMSELIRGSLGSDIRLETVLASGLWRTHADPNQLENVLLNLAVNARDAMPDGGRLTIETQNAHLDARYVAAHLGVQAGQYVMVAVTDTGSGMPDDVIAKAFDPFFTTKGVGKGTGLGLSQVYGFVKQTGGHVKIYSEPGQGTTVKVYLPRLLGAEYSGPDEGASADLPLGEAQEVILVVEDEAAVRQFSVDALSEFGYRVLEADGAATALRSLDAHPEIVLLFTDVVMPDVNGRKLADEARQRRPDLRVLFTTGYTRNAVVHNGVLDPGVELIGKPFTIEELAAKVREVLDGPFPDGAA